MPIVESEFAPLRDPRIAAQLEDHALGTSPAWLWSIDGSRVLWANAVAAAIFGAANAVESTQRRFAAKDHAAVEVLRLARTLPSSGQARLERLRGFGAGFGRALTCTCARVTLSDSRAAVLIIAAEPAGPALTLHQRVERLFPDHGQALAAFSAGGTLVYATAAAQAHWRGAATLSALGLDALGAQALSAGDAAGVTPAGPVEIDRLGRDAAAVLVVTFAAAEGATTVAPPPQPLAAPSPPPRPAAAPLPPAAPLPAAAPAEQAEAEAPHAGRGAPLPDSLPERRYPLRFVWQMDADGRFVVGSDEFIELVGPRTTAAFGRMWSEIAAALRLDPDNRVAAAVATRETWSGIVVSWPVDESSERLPVELSGLPVFDRDRQFRGYRGFGVCRDVGRINELTRARRERPLGLMPPEEAPRQAVSAPLPTAAPVVEPPNLAPPEPEPTTAPAPVVAAPLAPVSRLLNRARPRRLRPDG